MGRERKSTEIDRQIDRQKKWNNWIIYIYIYIYMYRERERERERERDKWVSACMCV